ncbi:MAG: hypothetical protein ACLP7Q_23005 [Isosphaeraceae bacterium]
MQELAMTKDGYCFRSGVIDDSHLLSGLESNAVLLFPSSFLGIQDLLFQVRAESRVIVGLTAAS